MIDDAMDVAFEHIIDYQKGLHEASIEKIKAAKPEMQVNVLTGDERAPFIDAAADVEATFLEMTGESGAAILEQMKADLDAVTD